MKLILSSSFNNSKKDENGDYYAVKLPKDFSTVIKKNINKKENVVFVANNPKTFEVNDKYGNLLFDSLKLSDINFKNQIILDYRNSEKSKEIITKADLIFLSGGSVECQLEFFKEIKLDKLLRKFPNLVVGGSAGAINLCIKALNFPTTEDKIRNITDNNCWLDGLNIYNRVFVPHFNGKTKEYIRGKNINAYNELLELSINNKFVAVDNDSFIYVNGDEIKCFGNVYFIEDKNVNNFNNIGDCL